MQATQVVYISVWKDEIIKTSTDLLGPYELTLPFWNCQILSILIRVGSYLTRDSGGRHQNERIHHFVSLTERATYTFFTWVAPG